MIRPGDRARLTAYDEILKAYPDGNTYAFINFAEDVQDIMIDMVVGLLKHTNPFTKLPYAQEPALCFIELQNEDDIFFYTSEKAFNACPTYKKLFIQRFSDWLKTKYATDDGLKKAWGASLKADETLEARNLGLQANPWFYSEEHLPQVTGPERQRLLDTAAFLHDAQNKYYSRFVKAIREAGYKGPINGSPWQAPSGLPHYYNLRSDYLVGYIDRHNYFGGGFSDTMLSHPGSGYFSTGLQQVVDRPFGLSEWIHVYPSLYSAEGPAILAAYGMGLQGWDASYEFQSNAATHEFSDIVGKFPWGVWEGDVPTQIGQFPALARMIYRNDVKEAPVISTRRISPQELAEGKFSFSDKVKQQGDIKTFGGTVPAAALAAGRVVVEFTDSPQPSTFPDMTKYEQGKVITSATGQLGLGLRRPGFLHHQHRRHQSRRRFRRRQRPQPRRHQDPIPFPLRLDLPHRRRSQNKPERRQNRPPLRHRPQLQHRLQTVRPGAKSNRQRQTPHHARTRQSHHHHHPPHQISNNPRPRRPPHRPNSDRRNRQIPNRQRPRQGNLLGGGLGVKRVTSLLLPSAPCALSRGVAGKCSSQRSRRG